MFIHLRAHTCYSFLEGLPRPAELARLASEAGMPALGLTDHNSLTGVIEFYDACHKAGVQPILGLEVEAELPPEPQVGPLALLAMDLAGWASLCRLSSWSKKHERSSLRDDKSPPWLPLEVLAENTDGLICLSGGSRGLSARLIRAGETRTVSQHLAALRELFPGRLYVELQDHSPEDAKVNVSLATIAHRLRLPAVATHSIYMLQAEDVGLQRLLSAIRLGHGLDELDAESCAPRGAYWVEAAEMDRRFSHFPAAVQSTQEITERCQLELPLGKHHYPDLELPPGITPAQQLRQKAEAGARRLYGDLTSPVKERLDRELNIIEECGYASLFLIMEEILAEAWRSGVPVSSRGSAASSLVAHCLRITSPDPLRLNLYFERFLNPARATPPDIDTDLCSRRRDGVIRFVYERFGQERVAMVCTINRFRPRSALREAAKAHGMPEREIKALTEKVPHRWWGPHAEGYDPTNPYGELAERSATPAQAAIFRDATALLGRPRHLSVHPGGMVISPGPLNDLVPTEMAAKGMIVTQFDLEGIERMGLVKIDLLGIRGLTVLGDVAASLESANGTDARQTARLEVLEAIPEDDQQTASLIQAGRTIGCFQIESPGMRATLKEIQAHTVDDLMVALALYRPGPLTGGLKNAFVRRHRGLEPPSHLHPALASLLDDTYGVILYQEQVLRIAHGLAGLSLADADLLRRAMSHFDPGKAMQTLKEKFIAGAQEHSGVPAEICERVWELMAAFAGYGFPKAHAASYATVGWRAAWCKAHHPALFMAAVLANWGGFYGQRVYLTEARRMGLALRPPEVNHAGREFNAVYLEGAPVLFMGLGQVRDLTQRTINRILHGRPFSSLQDFLARADPRPVEAESLARAGALEEFGSPSAIMRRLQSGGWRGGQLSLFDLQEEEAWTPQQKAAAQEAALGVSLDVHPLELAAGPIAAARAITTLEAAMQIGQRVRVAGMRQTWMRASARRGETLFLLSLEDLDGMLEVWVPDTVYKRSRSALSGARPLLVEGVVELDTRQGEPVIRAERIDEL